MKRKVFIMALGLLLAFASGAEILRLLQSNGSGQAPTQRILKVPGTYSTIQKAVEAARDGDWVIIAPGKYSESKIEIDKAITVASEWKTTGDTAKIKATQIDAREETLFTLTADGVEISGLSMINGDHTLDILANVTIQYNYFSDNLDALSFEGPGGGYAGFNTIENGRDDGIDIDIGSDKNNMGTDVVVEKNLIRNSNDDGIEIRLFSHQNQNIRYTIRENIIVGSRNAGIQLISYDAYTGKEFNIHHNIISGCKVGLGCMEGSNSAEDMSGAGKMDELVFFFNNTLVGNQLGATGGNRIIALNNLVQRNALGGFKRFGKNSAAVNNWFYENGGDHFVQFHPDVTISGHQDATDPQLDKQTFKPREGSPLVDAGLGRFVSREGVVFEVPSEYIIGAAPDIGAIETNKNP